MVLYHCQLEEHNTGSSCAHVRAAAVKTLQRLSMVQLVPGLAGRQLAHLTGVSLLAVIKSFFFLS